MPPTPQRASDTGGPKNTETSHASISPHSYPQRSDAFGSSGEQAITFAEFFPQAIDGAIALVRADGGEISTLDESRQMLVLRARSTRPRVDPASSMGMASRKSQPLRGPQTGSGVRGPNAATPTSFMQRADASRALSAPAESLDSQSTQLLPATQRTRTYGPGERLMGQCWQRAEPVIMRGEDCRMLPGGEAPRDPEAAWHVAVPILRPGSLATLHPSNEVIGVISVYNRDPLWPFSARDVELLVLHADRVARALQAAELTQQNQSQLDLMSVLGAPNDASHPQSLYVQMRDTVRHMLDAPSFAVLLTVQSDIWYALAERDGQNVPDARASRSAMPAWWNVVTTGKTLCVSAPEDRALHPEYCGLGWGGPQPVQSLLAAPLISGHTLLGAIVAGSPRSDAYVPEHAKLFTSIARSAAIFVQNAQLATESRESRARTHEKEQQLALLNNATLTLNASLDLDETIAALALRAKDLTEAAVCAVFVWEENQLVCKAVGVAGAKQATLVAGVRVTPSQPEIRALLNAGQYAVLDQLECEWSADDSTDLASDGARIAQQLQHIKSCLVVPVMHQETGKQPHSSFSGESTLSGRGREKSLGALVVFTPGQRHHFQPQETGLLSALASQGGSAISNAMLYRELQRAYEEQQVLDRLKQDFILQVSHEFRTPVTAIQGYVTLIGRHGHKLEQAKLDQYAEEIHQSTGQLMGMVSRLQDASSIGTQPLSLSLGPVNLRDAAMKALADQSPEAKLRVEVMTGSDLWAMGDGERVKAVLSNLLSNALKYSERKVHVTAQTVTREVLASQGRPHALKAEAPEMWVVAGVADEGEGIPPEDQVKLFQKFVRLPRSLVTSVRGTGLGLWICRQYLDAMGGDIWVESAIGRGSLFQFILPIAAPQANPS